MALVGTGATLLAIQAPDLAGGELARRFGLCCLAGAAAFLAGGLVGFVFGVPRRVQQGKPNGADYGYGPGYAGNTNLERISDWLAKILLGAGLTQLVKLPGAIADAGSYFQQSIGPSTGPLVAAILVYWSIAGFFTSYLLARRALPALWRRADSEGMERLKQEAKRALGEVAARNLGALEAKGERDSTHDIVFNALYLPAPGGFEKAIAAGSAVPVEKRSATLWYLLACAYGQKHAWAKRPGTAPDELADIRNHAYDAASRAIALDPP